MNPINRNAVFDHIRIVLTALVIFHHTAIVYGGSGGWYWREEADSSNLLLLAFNAINQSYFMGFFFLLSGYFTAASLERKHMKAFLSDRLIRLGVPLVVYFFIISPTTNAMVSAFSGESFWPSLKTIVLAGNLEPGPLWFVESLLLFSVIYLAWSALEIGRRLSIPRIPGVLKLAIISVGLGLLSFLIRLYIPVGESVLWLQLGYFPCYLFLFAAGCAAYRERLLEKINFRHVRPWIAISMASIISLPFAILNGIGEGSFNGGYNLNALFYALWDPFTAWGIILGMLWCFRKYWYQSTGVTRFLARRTYATYIIHPPMLVIASFLISGWGINPLLKFMIAGSICFIACIVVSSLLLSAPILRRVL